MWAQKEEVNSGLLTIGICAPPTLQPLYFFSNSYFVYIKFDIQICHIVQFSFLPFQPTRSANKFRVSCPFGKLAFIEIFVFAFLKKTKF
jgi:hypothetical protein